MQTRQFNQYLLFMIFCGSLVTTQNNSYGQAPDIKDHLLLHIPFDGDNDKSIKIFKYTDKDFTFVKQENNKIAKESRIYKQNEVLKVLQTTKDSLILNGITRFPLTISFWVRIKTTNPADRNISILNLDMGKYKLNLREKRKSSGNNTSVLGLRIFKPDIAIRETNLELTMNTSEWQLFTIQIDEAGLMKFAISNTIMDKGENGLLNIADPLINYSAPNLNVSDLLDPKDPKSNFKLSMAIWPGTKNRNISIDDIRVYDKILSKEEVSAVAINDPHQHIYLGKYQLAYTYKRIADEYYLKASDITRSVTIDPVLLKTARDFYVKARDAMLFWIDQTSTEGQALYDRIEKFQFASLKQIDEMNNALDRPDNKIRKSLPIANYYDLLLFDINYRLRLIDSGHSFWGKDITEKPLFPVQEYSFFTDAFEKFNQSYQKIESLLKTQQDMDEKQEINELQSQLAAHKSEIERIRIDETQFKVDFYSRQSANVQARMNGIEEHQKDLNRQVERKEQELKKLDAKIMGQLSGVISQATLGVSIDVTKNLGNQITTAGLEFLGQNNELSSSLLGSYRDVYDVAITAREYYQKGKEVFTTVKSLAEGGISADNLIKIGDAVAGSGFVNPEWSGKWTDMKKKFTDINQQYTEAKLLIKKVEMTAKNPNLKDIVGLVDWIATTSYVPENYKKDYQQFKEYREAAYMAVKDKKYDDLIKLGDKIFTDAGLGQEVNRIKKIVDDLKPAMIVVQMIKNPKYSSIKEKLITALTDGTLENFIDSGIQQDITFKILINFLRKPDINEDDIANIFQDLLNQAPEAMLECFPFRVQEDLYKIFNVNSFAKLVEQLKKFNLTDFPDRVRIHHDTLFVFEEAYPIEISRYLNITKASLTSIFNIIHKNQALLQEYKKSITPLELSRLFEKALIDGKQAESKMKEIYNAFIKVLNAGEEQNVKDEAVKFYLGNGTFQASVDKNVKGNLIEKIPPLVDPENPVEVVGENMGPLPAGDNSELMRNLAAKALDMAFPGVGTALSTVLNIADAIFSGYQIVDELRAIYKEKVDLNKEYVKLMDNLRENEFNKQIALYESRINNISYAIMLEEHEGFSNRVNSITDRKKDVRRKIGGHLPMLFFHAERLRYFYQRLNKSSTFWYGESNSLNKIIFGDPNNLRLAIDPDIKLFDWVTNPDVTSSREDIFRLFTYWARIHSLVTDGITSNRLKFGENLSEISYQVIDLKELDPGQWKSFERWQRNPNTPFNYTVDMTSSLSANNTFGFDSSYTSVKCIQVIPIAAGPNGKSIRNLLTVSNLGISTNELGVVEPLSQRSRSSGDEQLDIVNGNGLVIPANYLGNLKTRWNKSMGDYQPYNFEGYNLRSNWKVSISPGDQSSAISKIYFVVFYQYTKDYSRLQASFASEYLYKVKFKYNSAAPSAEYLNVSLPINPTLVASTAERYKALIKKYPNLEERNVKENDLTPYLNSGQPIILNRAALDDIRFSNKIEQPVSKKKCFLSNLFKNKK